MEQLQPRLGRRRSGRIGALLAVAVALATAAPALAGDVAELNVIGFSPEGAYFAFEQYGIQDGSGFPYADIIVLDVAANAWVAGTPAEVLLQDEGASEDAARKAALSKAAPVLGRTGIREGAEEPLVRHLLTDRSVDPEQVRFALWPHAPGEYELRLETWPAPESVCEYPREDAPPRLFALALVYPDGRRLTLQKDSTLPKSRGCAFGYRIAEVWLHRPDFPVEAQEHSLVVLLNVFTPGFEGPNATYLAVSGRVPALTPDGR